MLSILMVTWNRLYYVRQTLDAIRLNTDVRHELVIVDNGSVDGTPEYLRSLAVPANGEYKFLFNESNRGLPVALNQALAASKGDMICYAGSDMVVPPEWTSTLLDAFGKFTGSIGGRSIGWMNPIVSGEVPWIGKMPKKKIGDFQIALGPPVAGANGVTERKRLDEIGGFLHKGFKYGGVDGSTIHALHKRGHVVCWLENVTVVHLEAGDRERYGGYWRWKLATQEKIRNGWTGTDDPKDDYEWPEDATED